MMKILLWIIALPFIFLALFIVLRFAFCRPNYFVVKTATPVVEKIADYIVEHGLPERLDEIPDLPYKLEECSQKEVYWKDRYDVVKTKAEARRMELFYSCKFFKNKTMYQINSRFAKTFSRDKWSGKVGIESSDSHIGVSFRTDTNNKLIRGSVGSGFSKTGICSQFKM